MSLILQMVSATCYNPQSGAIRTGVIFAILWVLILYAIAVEDSGQQILNEYFDNPGAYISAMLFLLTGAVVSVLLVAGAVKKNTHYMLPWLVMHLAVGILHFLDIVVICSTSIFTGTIPEPLPIVLRALVLLLVMTAWAGVCQYYNELNSRMEKPLTDIATVSTISAKLNEPKETVSASKEIGIKG